MQIQSKTLVFSATDLANHLSCSHLTQLSRRTALGELTRPFRHDPLLETLIERGQQHEEAYVQKQKDSGRTVIDVSVGSGRDVRTLEAMKAGADVIVQAELRSGHWLGYADLLLRTSKPSELGEWSYEVVDTKLAQETKGTTILQLCLYSELLSELQGVMPTQMVVVKPGEPFHIDAYRLDDFLAYYQVVKENLEEAAAVQRATYPEPVAHCEICNWWTTCNERRRADDHLSFIAGIRSDQTMELKAQNRDTLKAFADAAEPLDCPPIRGSVESFQRIHRQAQIQHAARTEETLKHELLPIEDGRGFLRLPEPNPGDVFFDIEGARHAPDGGLEYLLGYVLNENDTPTFHELWALNRTQEKAAFEAFIDFLIDRWQLNPGMHIYHYAPYEQSAMKRLAMRHATRENEVDRLLRADKFIDLYAVVRQGLIASVESYSIKCLEPFYGYDRDAELTEARHGLQRLERTLELGAADVLAEDQDIVRIYNRDDCISTLMLRDWLETLRQQMVDAGHDMPRPDLKDGAASETAEERSETVGRVFDRLVANLPDSDRDQNEQARWLLAYLLDYFRREDKCVWWEYFRMQDLLPDEVLIERTALSGLEFVEEIPPPPRARSVFHRYRFPPQEGQLRAGDDLVEVNGENIGTVAEFDLTSGIVDIKKRGNAKDVHPADVFVFNRVRAKPLPESLLAFADAVSQQEVTDPPQNACYALLSKQKPKLKTSQLPMTGEIVDVAIRLAKDLDRSVLPIQGPPGAGKTYLGSHMIAALAADGHKVGVTAVSHKVITNLLEAVVENCNSGVTVAQKPRDATDVLPDGINVLKNTDAAVAAVESGCVVGGTAWLWASEAMEDQLDYLFIDEAGQMSLAIALAAGRAAKNIVLLGDPQQLEQPQQGTHPEGAEIAALNHLLNGRQTISRDRGLFIDQTWRLNPAICEFTSEQFYEGRLTSRPGLECQIVNGNSEFTGCGLRYVPVEHDGNQNQSVEEVEVIVGIFDQLLDGNHTWINQKGEVKTLTLKNILVVAPYNAQVATLQNRLPTDAKVGTVDKFQGQEAAIVIYSMTSSSAEDAPRGMSFLYSPNRLNVATSRARCLVILVGCSMLFQPECATPEQMKLANAFCRYLELALATPSSDVR